MTVWCSINTFHSLIILREKPEKDINQSQPTKLYIYKIKEDAVTLAKELEKKKAR
jgi:hypothetical protein